MRLLIAAIGGFALAGCGGSAEPDWDRDNAGLTSPLNENQLRSAIEASLELVVGTNMGAAWQTIALSEQLSASGCPDFGGMPGGQDFPGAQGGGTGWTATCSAGANTWAGYLYWELEQAGDGSFDRRIWGDGLVGTEDAVSFEFDGDGRDELVVTPAGFEYESTVFGTMTGDLAFDPATSMTPGGYRTDMFLAWSQGERQEFVAEGDVLLFDHLFDGRFDSVSVDLDFQGPAGADADDCTIEPAGLLSFRDADADWYDVVFEPKYLSNLDYDNAPYSGCDSCGTVYYRGFEQARELCIDFDFLWDELLIQPSTN